MKKYVKTLSVLLTLPLLFISCATTSKISSSSFEESVLNSKSLSSSNAKEYYEASANCIRSGDFEGVEYIINEWDKEAPKDADLYTMKYNLLFNKGYVPQMKMSETIPDVPQYFSTVGEKTNKKVYVYQEIVKDEELITEALSYLEQALVIHPNRLDIWFGLMTSCIQADRYDKAFSTYSKLLNQLKQNKNRWIYTLNEDVEGNYIEGGNDNQVADILCEYIQQLYEKNTTESIAAGQKMSKMILDVMPTNLVVLFRISIYEYSLGNVDKGISILEKAFEQDPSNLDIIQNLAIMNALQKRRSEFDVYYKLLMDSGEEGYIKSAQALLQDNFED